MSNSVADLKRTRAKTKSLVSKRRQELAQADRALNKAIQEDNSVMFELKRAETKAKQNPDTGALEKKIASALDEMHAATRGTSKTRLALKRAKQALRRATVADKVARNKHGRGSSKYKKANQAKSDAEKEHMRLFRAHTAAGKVWSRAEAKKNKAEMALRKAKLRRR